ncbi:9490_t:CDS:2 [Racocetra fulgida]|uniref:9490_t:CDS:1 n=1 Tax=Racocetra fulgida TaxID=60492 RepID=A0A9N9G1H7_9GLOM|nr:9490_t:CDS:2 [Racocetra fulgida]
MHEKSSKQFIPEATHSSLESLHLPFIQKEQPSYETLSTVLQHFEYYFLDRQTKPIWETSNSQEYIEETSFANRRAIDWLTRLIASPLEWIHVESQREEVVERAAKCIAAACGPIIRDWSFPAPPGNNKPISLKIRDSTLLDDDVGFKTWGAAYLLAKRCTSGQAMPLDKIQSTFILEIGTGTGLVGLTCAMIGCLNVLLTDYHLNVLSNVAYNINLNQLQNVVKVEKLDWKDIANGVEPEFQQKFDIIVGADIVYEVAHANWIPKVIKKFMKKGGTFYLMIPLRPTHTLEVELFERCMEEQGFILQSRQDQQGLDDFSGIQNYRYYEFKD